jgi:hypothetical protein
VKLGVEPEKGKDAYRRRSAIYNTLLLSVRRLIVTDGCDVDLRVNA